MKSLMLVILVFMAGCRDMPYRPDIGYMPSAMGNSAEFPLWVDGAMCKDAAGGVGFCAVRVKQGKDIIFQVLAQQYAFTVRVSCTSSVLDRPVEVSVPKGSGFKYTLSSGLFNLERVFNCTVMVVPLDRPEPIASFARASFLVVSGAYSAAPAPVRLDGWFVFGPHAKYVWVEDKLGRPKWYKETTYIKDTGVSRAIVETQQQRISTYGF